MLSISADGGFFLIISSMSPANLYGGIFSSFACKMELFSSANLLLVEDNMVDRGLLKFEGTSNPFHFLKAKPTSLWLCWAGPGNSWPLLRPVSVQLFHLTTRFRLTSRTGALPSLSCCACCRRLCSETCSILGFSKEIETFTC